MSYFLSGVVVTALAVFLYRKVKEGKFLSGIGAGGRPSDSNHSDKV